MKKIILTMAAAIGFIAGHAQWMPLNSTTANHLRDVDFIDSLYGVIVGDGGIILLTADGGQTWSDINNNAIHGDIYSVSLVNTDTLYVSSYDPSTTSSVVYVSLNTGANWTAVTSTSVTNHKADLELNGHSDIFETGTDLMSSSSLGAGWDTLVNGIAGTTSIDHLRFADGQTGHASGLQSGFITYSTYFYRTDDGGANWFAGDVFSFPNADAFTSMCFIHPDTAYMFTNHYAGFTPSNQNGMIKMYNFNKVFQFGDTVFTFSSQVINSATPSYMTDAYFMDADTGYTTAVDGNVYKTTDGGVNWMIDYTGSVSSPMLKMEFINNVGYAIGKNGVLIKNSGITTGITTADVHTDYTLYPVPAADQLTIYTSDFSENTNASILDANGKLVAQFVINAPVYTFNTSSLSPGIYFLSCQEKGSEKPIQLKWVKK